MFDHVLVPLDHSSLAEAALGYARHMVDVNGRITLLTVVDAPENDDPVEHVSPGLTTMASMPVAIKQNARVQAENYLNQVVYRVQKLHLDVNTIVQIGLPADVIVDTARNLGVKVIVMSTHGRTGLGRWIYGSVTQKVLSAAPCPVLVIPSRVQPHEAES
ncbi:MAG: universal stress protein [Anaerolineae bacterium]|nr:universal stress protein [Anaerolineae bacterium]